MAYQTMTERVAGYIVSASADWNKIVNNFLAIWVGTTAGDTDYYSSGTAKTRLPIGAAGTVYTSTGSAPSWVAFYPVGSIYISTLSTNPGTLLGFGTWVAFAAGKVLVGLDSADEDFDTVRETGGAKEVSLTAAQNGAHTHTYNRYNGVQNVDGGAASAAYYVPSTGNTSSSGSGEAHENMPPYIVVYMWERTA